MINFGPCLSLYQKYCCIKEKVYFPDLYSLNLFHVNNVFGHAQMRFSLHANVTQPISGQCYHVIPLENSRKPKISGLFRAYKLRILARNMLNCSIYFVPIFLFISMFSCIVQQQCCISYRKQLFDLHDKSSDWFLYEMQHCC